MRDVPLPTAVRSRWYRSLYWRIGVSFVGFVGVLLAGQSLMFSYLMDRGSGPFAPGRPNATAAAVAAAAARALARNPQADLGDVLRTEVRASAQRTYLLTRGGDLASNTPAPLDAAIRAQAEAMLRGVEPDARATATPTGPTVTAPVHWAGRLEGLVIMPPPPRRGLLADAGELLSLPGTLALLGCAAVAALLIFAPARRRLRALEEAASRLGGGDRTAAAPEDGQDEIARVAVAFNRMAAELTARDHALRNADAQRRRMLADVSHELRTPLTAMRGYLDTLAMPDLEIAPETRVRYLATVRRETSRLETIVSDLLDLAKFDNAAISLDVRVFAIARVFDQVRERYARDAAEAGVTIATEIDERADQLLADPHRIDQAVGNLVANALRHTNPGGTVRLRASAHDGTARLTVIDTGTGIAPEHAPFVFERFYKADASRGSGAQGSGLGLSIVKAIVERHGGRITVDSVPGRTAFVIDLPGGVVEG